MARSSNHSALPQLSAGAQQPRKSGSVQRRTMEVKPAARNAETRTRRVNWTRKTGPSVAALPLVVTFFATLNRSQVKHAYNLSKTVRIPAPYMVFCDGVACDAILEARKDSARWHKTTLSRGWSMARLAHAVARALNATVDNLMRAAEASAGDRLHCRSAELVLIWLAKPVLLGLAMARFPQQQRFAWVDAGFNAYNSRTYRSVPTAPWTLMWPSHGVALRLHHKCCKPPHIRPYQNRSCVQGTFLFGSSPAWQRFIAAYVKHVARVVHSQASWAGRRCTRSDVCWPLRPPPSSPPPPHRVPLLVPQRSAASMCGPGLDDGRD